MSHDLKEKFVADDGVSSVPSPVIPAGGKVKKRLADLNKKVDQDPKKLTMPEDEEELEKNLKEDEDLDEEDSLEEISIRESIASIFEGMDLSEDFKKKVSMVFEAAVNEAATIKASKITEQIEEEMSNKIESRVNDIIDEIVESLDSYLDYIISEWMEDNKIAIESGIKVEMAESFMEGLKTLFIEHNIDIDDEKVDVVSVLENQVVELEKKANEVINENIELIKLISEMQAEKVFNEIAEGLTVSQKERLKILSEKIDKSDLDEYASSLQTLKESFFKKKNSSVSTFNEKFNDEEEPLLTEETKSSPSGYSSVDAIVKALNNRVFK